MEDFSEITGYVRLIQFFSEKNHECILFTAFSACDCEFSLIFRVMRSIG